MAKKVDPAKAKAARQKKIAIGLGVLLLGVMAIQGPKTLKMLKGPQAAAAPAPAATPSPATPATPAPAAPTAGAPAVAAASPTAPATNQPAVLVSSDLPTAGPGQLESFELFVSKDPFAQQVDPHAPIVVESEGGAGAPPAAKPAAPATPAPGPTPAPSETGGTTAPAEPTPPPAPAAVAATVTSISVNGVPATAAVGKEFPESDPIFVLVSTAADGKSVQIGIAGGTYANGKDTITLTLGKPLTLQNTADGTRFELVLESVAGFVTPKKQ